MKKNKLTKKDRVLIDCLSGKSFIPVQQPTRSKTKYTINILKSQVIYIKKTADLCPRVS